MNALNGSSLVLSMEQAMAVIRRLDHPTTKTVVDDVETTGLDWTQNYIVGHVLTLGPAPSDTYYVPVRHGAAGGRDANVLPGHQYDGTRSKVIRPHPFEIELDRVARSRRDLHWIGHNFQFDLMFQYGHDIEFVGTMEDTQTNAALLNEHQDSFSLDYCCKAMGTQAKLGDELYRHLASKFGGEPVKSQMGNYWRLDGDDPIGVDYAQGDGVATWALRARQLERLAAEDLMGPWKAESDVLRVIHRMAKRGVRIDRAKLDEVIAYAQAKEAAAMAMLPADFNSRSPVHVRKLMEASGITNWPRKPPTPFMIVKAAKLGKEATGNPEFNEAFLKSTPIGRSVIDARRYSNINNSFAIPLRDRHTHADSRVRTTFHPMRGDDFGTVTARFSSSNPNLQQVPKRNKELAQLFRQVFVPDDGMIWWDADYSQCEPRLLAHYSGSKVLLEGYLATPHVDAHQAVATAAGIDREDGKRLNQTLITGGGRDHIIGMLGPKGADIYNAYFEAMPEVRRLQKNAAQRIISRGYVMSLLGRRCRLDHSRFAYKAVNRLLQTGNADVIKRAMIRVDRYLEETGDQVHIMLTIHDALSFQAPDTPEGRQIAETAIRMMSDFGPGRDVELRVPLGVEYGIGQNWSQATFPKDKVYVQ